MSSRINRALELLAQDQAIYYVGGHSGHVLTHSQGCQDARTWADYKLRGSSRFGGFMVRRATRRQLDEALDGLGRAVGAP